MSGAADLKATVEFVCFGLGCVVALVFWVVSWWRERSR